MDINQFIDQLNDSLALLNFVDNVNIEQQSITYVKIKVTLKPKGYLIIWYNAVRKTQSFSLILEDVRKWGFDFDNRIGWHEHSVENQSMHISTKSKTVHEIIDKFQIVWNNVIDLS